MGSDLLQSAWRNLRHSWRQLLLVDLAYKLLAYTLLTPLFGMLLQLLVRLSGEPFVADMDILWFLLQPLGLIAGALLAAIGLAIVALEQAALLAVLEGHDNARPRGVLDALRFAAGNALRILRVAARIVGLLLATAIPFLGAAGLVYVALLTRFDINYYLDQRPPQFWIAVVLGGCFIAAYTAWVLYLTAGWIFALPLVLFEGVRPGRALGASRERLAGHRRRVILWLAGWLAAAFLLSTLVNLAIGVLGTILIPAETRSLTWVLFRVGLLLLLTAVANLAANALLTISFATLFWSHYARQRDRQRQASGEPSPAAPPGFPFRLTRPRLAAAAVIGALLATVVGAVAVRGIPLEDHAEITAHRGASAAAPENTLAAVRRAIADRADWVEVDVQETADGQVVVFHDSDFKKAAGVDLKIWNATLEDLRQIDIGSRFGAEFQGERVPTLDGVLAECQGRIGVNIELKYYGHDQQLERRVVEIVEARRMQSQVVLMSLKRDAVLKLKTLRPDWRVGLLAAVAVGDLSRFEADFLAVNTGLADPLLIRAAHRRGKQVHVWTVNDAVTMSSMLSRGVDNLITDDPALARSVLEQRAGLSAMERLLLAMAGEVWHVPEQREGRGDAESVPSP